MMHLATPQLDRGPVITYCTFPIKGEPFNKYWQEIGSLSIAEIKRKQGENNTLFKLIRQHGEIRELPFIVLTLKALGKKEVRIEKGEILDNLGNLMAGYDLSYEVNKMCGTK